MRFKIPHRGIQLLHFRSSHIGRIGHDQIEFSEKRRRRLGDVHRNTGDPARQLQVCDILFRHPQSCLGNIRKGDLRVLDPAGDGKADAAGAGAKIQDPGILLQIHGLFNGQVRHRHGIVPGDQHVRRYGQGHIVEVPLAQNVGNGLPLQMPAHIVFGPAADLLGGVKRPIRHDGLRRLAGGGAEQLPGHIGGVHAVCGQHGLSGVQVQVGVGFYHLSAPSSSGRTRVSASMATSIMESSGSLVVKFWNHMPGAVRIRVNQLSCRPTRRLIS